MKNLHNVINPYARQVVRIGSCFNSTESFSRHLPQLINVQNGEKKSHTRKTSIISFTSPLKPQINKTQIALLVAFAFDVFLTIKENGERERGREIDLYFVFVLVERDVGEDWITSKAINKREQLGC
jgi:hypothetical protein